jgi:hypothetical protein
MKNKEFYSHFKNVSANAEHHAPHVNKVLVPLAFSILSLSDEGSITPARRSKFGGFTNPVKFRKNGNPYTASYNHEKSKILIRKKNSKGEVIYEFDNNNSDEVSEIIESL